MALRARHTYLATENSSCIQTHLTHTGSWAYNHVREEYTYYSGHDNFFTVELIDAQDERVEYTVDFKLSRAPSKARLNLTQARRPCV
jgi:hypothetical protein